MSVLRQVSGYGFPVDQMLALVGHQPQWVARWVPSSWWWIPRVWVARMSRGDGYPDVVVDEWGEIADRNVRLVVAKMVARQGTSSGSGMEG